MQAPLHTFALDHALCIMQDSEEDRDYQVNKMDIVYTGAMLTIGSAACKDSNGGLPGLWQQ
jgi:hypothetical protein